MTGLYNLSTFKRKVAQVLRMAGRNEIYADLFLILTRTESKEQCVQKLLEANQVLNEYIKQKYPSGNIYENTGVYFWENDSYDIEELIERVYFNSIKEEKDKERLIASGFYTALNNEEFEIYLQPKFLLNERTIYGAFAGDVNRIEREGIPDCH